LSVVEFSEDGGGELKTYRYEEEKKLVCKKKRVLKLNRGGGACT
jgi:hypothetical protein